ncbi:sulfurtransferase [Hoeflea prorocentri]|uniref:Sulfurtransferase n=1 Tax=Hoeflea prorocentri TaxID=1922333 RepID=A0A9X3UFS2_9HYPH|nr:sulfurtransferase [Hoeflea prorocentri]MCY6380523.1 sulfurtransferase [Hoeflea prorocentri]MDA5398323.1 sulfurtransferase [Hoeflea prorocentri]
MESLVSTDWLSRNIGEPDLVVLDCRVHMEPHGESGFRCESARAAYDAGHIPSAGFADLMGDLSVAHRPGAFALPAPEQFCAAMGALGVGDRSRVVLYDGLMSIWAARVWWMLKWVGFDNAAILDGGFPRWEVEGRPLSTDADRHPEQTLTLNLRPGLVADAEEVKSVVAAGGACLIDTLPEAHFSGEESLYGRPGHIPGAANLFAGALVDEAGRYLPEDALAKLVTGDKQERQITYCGAGVMASSNAFIMSRLGFKDVAVYMGSLQEWLEDPDNPMETSG